MCIKVLCALDMLPRFQLPRYLSRVLEDNSAHIPKIHQMFMGHLFLLCAFGRSGPRCRFQVTGLQWKLGRNQDVCLPLPLNLNGSVNTT
jgi:hypothetical protein